MPSYVASTSALLGTKKTVDAAEIETRAMASTSTATAIEFTVATAKTVKSTTATAKASVIVPP